MPTSGVTLRCNSRSPNSRDRICAPRARYTLGHGRAGTTRSRHHASSFIIQGLRIQLHTKPHATAIKTVGLYSVTQKEYHYQAFAHTDCVMHAG